MTYRLSPFESPIDLPELELIKYFIFFICSVWIKQVIHPSAQRWPCLFFQQGYCWLTLLFPQLHNDIILFSFKIKEQFPKLWCTSDIIQRNTNQERFYNCKNERKDSDPPPPRKMNRWIFLNIFKIIEIFIP